MEKQEINVEEEYNKLKFKLPNFKELDNEFEISFIKEKHFLLRSIRRKVTEKVIFCCRIIESLIYPTQTNIITATEVKNFNENQKRNMERIYKELMVFERESLMLDIIPSDNRNVDIINKIFNHWSKLKGEMVEIIEIMKNSWVKEEELDKDNYFG